MSGRSAWFVALATIACGGISIDSVTPDRGLNTTTIEITLRGAGFDSSCVVWVGDAQVATSFVSASELRATVPAALDGGLFDVAVKSGSRSARLAAAFRVLPSSLRIVAIEIGQGDATFVLSPTGKAGLIDQGKPGRGDKVIAAMTRYGVTALDFIVVSHYDSDHYGSAVEVPLPSVAYDRGDPPDGGDWRFQAYRSAMGNRRKTVVVGETIDLGGGTTMKFVVANGRVFDAGVVATNPGEENENSVGVVISHGRFRYLSAGDLPGSTATDEADVETTLGNVVGDVDVYHVSHHGSAGSSSDAFLRKVKPEVAVISEGVNNQYCHPAQSTLNRLSNQGTRVYSTNPGITQANGSCAATAFPAGSRVLYGDIEISTVSGDSFTVAGDTRADDGAP